MNPTQDTRIQTDDLGGDSIGDALARAGMQLGQEGLDDALDLGDALIEAPAPAAMTTAAIVALYILVPAIPALVGTLHMMGASARGATKKRRRRESANGCG